MVWEKGPIMMKCSVGVCAHNEEKNIGRLLDNLRSQAGDEIMVVASGCTDGTIDIVKNKMADDGRIKLLAQEKREGKSSAVNLFIRNSSNDLLVLISADVLPDKGAIQKLIGAFEDAKVGMAGARPVPVNTDETFIGFCANYMWRLHHLIALEDPKCGEMVAFRKAFEGIPPESAVDEASIEKEIRKKALEIRYVPEAVVRNKGPETAGDFIRQRRRIAFGHSWLEKKGGYAVSTLGAGRIFGLIFNNPPAGAKRKIWVPGMVALEAMSRLLGRWDCAISRKDAHIWDVAKTTKKL